MMITKKQAIKRLERKICESAGVPPQLRPEYCKFIRKTMYYKIRILSLDIQFFILETKMKITGIFKR